MKRKRRAAAAVVLIAVLAVTANVAPSAAQDPPPPIATEFLTDRAVFTDNVRLRVRIKLEGLPAPWSSTSFPVS